jgi:hypothetical protein
LGISVKSIPLAICTILFIKAQSYWPLAVNCKLLDQEILLEKGYAYTLEVTLVQDKGKYKKATSSLTVKKEPLNPI